MNTPVSVVVILGFVLMWVILFVGMLELDFRLVMILKNCKDVWNSCCWIFH